MEIIEVFDEFNNSLNYSVSRDEIHEKKTLASTCFGLDYEL